MAIKKALASKNTSATETSPQEVTTPSKKMFPSSDARATTLRLYVDDERIVDALKEEAFKRKTSISKLFKEWATDWLENEAGRSDELNFD